MKYYCLILFITGAIFTLSSCDCNQNVRGVVIDSLSKKPLDSVAIINPHKYDTVYSDRAGNFEMHDISGGLAGCPPMGLSFYKSGYKPLSEEYESGSSQTIMLSPLEHIDTAKYAVLKFDPDEDRYIFGKDNKPADLSADEIAKIESVIARQVAVYNKKENATYDSLNKTIDRKKYGNAKVYYSNAIDDPKKYYKQFITVINPKGQKEVWVNCFCDKQFGDNDWKKSLVMVDDGGSCFFQLHFNLTTNKVIFFGVNGVA